MRPLELHIEGFMAFREAVKIDFRPMQLFVLSGPTGAGKSSILDAMCFALYGETPRLGSRDLKKVLHHDAENPKPQAYVSFAFQHYANAYRITRQLSLTKHQVELEIDAEGSWEPYFTGSIQDFKKKIPELLGLDFEAFKKVILLPQGGFDQFLKQDSPSERRKFLMSLARLDVYDRIREAADVERRSLRENIAALEGEEKGIAALDPEALQLRETALLELEKQKDADETKRAELLIQKQAAEAQWQLCQEIDNALHSKKQLDLAESLIQEKIKKVKQGKALLQKQGELKQLQKQKQQSKNIQQALQGLEQRQQMQDKTALRLQNEKTELDNQEALIPEIRENLEQLQGLKPQLEALQRIREKQQENHQELKSLEQEQKDKHTSLEDLKQRFTQKQTEHQALQNQAQPPDIERMEILQALGPELKQHQEQATPALEELEVREASLRAELHEQKNQIFKLRDTIEAFRESVAASEIQLKKAQEDYEAARLLDEASALRNELKAGDDCPVCLQRVKTLPQIHATHNLQNLSQQVQKLQKSFEDAKARTQKSEQEELSLRAIYNSNRTQLKALKNEFESQKAKFAQENQRLKQALNIEMQKDLPPVQAIRKEFMQLKDQQKQFEKNQEKHRALELQCTQIKSEIQIIQNELELIQKQANKQQNLLQEYEQESQKYEHAARELLKLDEQAEHSDFLLLCQRLEKRKKQKIENIQNERKSFDSRQKDWQDLQVQLDTHRESLKQQLTELSQDIADLQIDLKDALHALGYEDPESALKALPDEGDLNHWENEIQSHQHARIRLESELERLQQQLGEARISESEVKTLQANYIEAEHKAERSKNEWRSEKDFLALQAEKRKQSYEIITQRLEESKKLERYERIFHDLGQRNLPDFLAKRVMERVIHGASKELMLLSQERYAFFVDENEELVILDHSNCGAPRSVKTLSGGESFLASLALALALHDYLSAGVQLDSLFIDEGFGTLDSEALEQAASVIEQLQREGKCIGVITHIQELAERFEYQIQVTPSETGSQLTVR